MNENGLITNLVLEYWGIVCANSDYNETLWDFLIRRKIPTDEIWLYSLEIGRAANQAEPDWM